MDTPKDWLDLGTLLFAFVIFWAYVAFSQFLIIWSGNLPGETVWYRHRGAGGWEWLGWIIGAICFFAPAAVLLFQSVKKNRRLLSWVSIGIFVSQAIYLFWVVAPAFLPSLRVSVMDFLMPIGVGLIWGGFFWKAWQAASPWPRNDPRLAIPRTVSKS